MAVKRSLDVLPAGLHVAQSIIFHGKLVASEHEVPFHVNENKILVPAHSNSYIFTVGILLDYVPKVWGESIAQQSIWFSRTDW